jgi:hypothetical protein
VVACTFKKDKQFFIGLHSVMTHHWSSASKAVADELVVG